MNTIGKRISDARKMRKMTQKELADKIGKTTSSIQKYELDIAEPPLKVIDAIGKALDIPQCQIIFGECPLFGNMK